MRIWRASESTPTVSGTSATVTSGSGSGGGERAGDLPWPIIFPARTVAAVAPSPCLGRSPRGPRLRIAGAVALPEADRGGPADDPVGPTTPAAVIAARFAFVIRKAVLRGRLSAQAGRNACSRSNKSSFDALMSFVPAVTLDVKGHHGSW